MIAPKLAKLLIWKMRQGITVYQSSWGTQQTCAVSMLSQHRRRCANIETALGEFPVLAGNRRKRGTPPRDAKPMPPLTTVAQH